MTPKRYLSQLAGLVQRPIPVLVTLLVVSVGLNLYQAGNDQALREQLATSGAALTKQYASLPAPTPTATPAVATAQVPPLRTTDHLRGDRNAPVVMIEYSDYECPFCKAFHSTLTEVEKEYGGKVALAYRQFPLSFHANAEKEAEASECIAALGGNDKFWAYTDTIFSRTTSNGTGFALANLPGLAEEIGVDKAAFSQCLDSGRFASAVQASENEGMTAGVQGTPGTFLVGKGGTVRFVSGAQPLAQVKQAIDALLQ